MFMQNTYVKKAITIANPECMPMAAVLAPKFSASTCEKRVKKPARSSMVLASTGLLGAPLKALNSFTGTPSAFTKK
jgi:hypothetical protein